MIIKLAALCLAIAAFGMLFFGLIYVMTTIITASGRPTVSLIIGVVTLATSAGLNTLLIPDHGIKGAAIGMTASMLLGAMIGGGYLITKFGALMPVISILRIALCSGLIYAASIAFTPASKVLIVGKLAVLCIIYVIALVVVREIGRDDLADVKKVLKR